MPASAAPSPTAFVANATEEPPPDAPEVEPAKPTSTTPLPPPGTASAAFDKNAAASALSKVPVQACTQPGGPTGSGHVTLTFAPLTGHIVSVALDGGPFAGTPTGSCIMQAFRRAKVAPFGGAAVRVGKSFTL